MILMLPVEKLRVRLEDTVENFIELLLLNDPNQFIDYRISANLKTISSSDKPDYFLAQYLQKFTFFKRLSISNL
jgi:hypothetical protein